MDIHTTRNSPYEITIGDALGENCSSSIIEDDIIPIFKNIFSEGGLRSDMIDQMIGYSATEDPSNPAYRYRGGYITNRYGAASTGDMGMTGISAFQIEVNRTTCEEAPDLVTNLFTRFFSELHEHREEIFLPTVRRL